MEKEYKTRGIVLHTMKYGDHGSIVYMYTEEFGRISYFMRGGRNGKPMIGKSKTVLHPLSVLDYIATTSNNGSLHKFKEAKRSFITPELLFDIRKSAIVLYISELLYRVVRDNEPNPYLFDFILHSIKNLDALKEGISNFHIYFTVKLASFMGFSPFKNWEDGMYLDMKSGKYVIIKPDHISYFSAEESLFLNIFSNASLEDLERIKMNRNQRVALLERVVSYFEYHHETSYKIASLKILSEIF